jgi:hypothetical protein
MRRRLLLVVALLVLAGLQLGAAHPCDVAPSGPWIVRTGRGPVLGWCQAGTHTGFLVSVDGVVFDLRLQPAVSGTGLLGTYYTWSWPGSMQKGSHVFSIRAYTNNSGTPGPAASLTFTRP